MNEQPKTIKQPSWYFWNPQPDITTLELARCMPMFVAATVRQFGAVEQAFESLPPECKRHWEIRG